MTDPYLLESTLQITFSLAIGALGLIAFSNLRRTGKKSPVGDTEALTPNCILTRFPILFIQGRRSLFYFSEYFNTLPSFLAEHGYEVYKTQLPWRNALHRTAALKNLLDSQKKPIHIILTHETWLEFASVLQHHPRVLGKVLLDSTAKSPPPRAPQRLLFVDKIHSFAWQLHTFIVKDPTSPTTLGLYRSSLPEISAQREKSLLKEVVKIAENDLIENLQEGHL